MVLVHTILHVVGAKPVTAELGLSDPALSLEYAGAGFAPLVRCMELVKTSGSV